jgi:hypothetical protein
MPMAWRLPIPYLRGTLAQLLLTGCNLINDAVDRICDDAGR